MQSIQIFMSYAWKDNTLPPGDRSEKKGFIAALGEQIEYWFDLSSVKPSLWWDRPNVDDAQQFRPAIKQAIDQSSFFLVVLSEHWIASEYCQLELKLFRERWCEEDDYTFGHRIIVAHKTVVPKEKYPKLFPEQRGLQFFSISGRTEIPFYHLGKGTEAFYSLASELGHILLSRAKHEDPPPPHKPSRPLDGALKIYLSKPAPDMREPYLRLHKELLGQGFNVVPPASAEIPLERAAATKFIDEALADARVSVHVIGKSAGHAPADLAPIVKLQLAKAAEKVAASGGGQSPSEFRRIIWAPRIVEDAKGLPFERDPIETLKASSQQLASDRIEGDSISPFVEFLLKHLGNIGASQAPPPPSVDGQIYLCHDETDTSYAIEVAELLEQHNISYVMPAYYNTSDSDRRQFHKENLSECTAVMMCWANASEMWARAQSKELRNWQALGRKQQFACRGLIAGPPPDARKDDKLLRHLFPPRDIDVVFNWTHAEKPTSDTIGKLFAAEINVLR